MGEFLISEIDFNEVSVEEFNLDVLMTELSNELKESNLLCNKDKVKTLNETLKEEVRGNFSDKIWVVVNGLEGKNSIFNFIELEEYKFIGMNEYEINLIKCWVAESILESRFEDEYTGDTEYRNVFTVRKRYGYLLNFIKESSFFNEKYLDDTKGCKLTSYFSQLDVSDTTASVVLRSLLSYIDYVIDKVGDSRDVVLDSYYSKLLSIKRNYVDEKSIRELPSSKNILLYHNYIDLFFNDSDIDNKLRLLYMPIYLWWRITTIIPMRTNEFTTRLKRECLQKGDGNYFLKINRSKKKYKSSMKTLPVLKRVKITREIYDIIDKYIKETDEYGESKTLISYAAIKQLRLELFDKSSPFYTLRLNGLEASHNLKIDHTTFSKGIMYNLIHNFNENIIKGYYQDTHIDEWVKLGDTRHIAFTSLMLQGYSPVEIAVLGGHTTLKTLDNYTSSTSTYIDTEVVSIIRKNINFGSINYSQTIDKIFSMPKECPKLITECVEAYFGDERFGYCTADYKNKYSPCESARCDKCSKWWCEPNEYNYLRLERILKEDLQKKNSKLSRDIDFLMELMSEVGIEYVDGKMILEPEAAKAIKRISLDLASNTRNIIHLKYELIDPLDDKYKLLSSIEELLPTKEVTSILERKYMLHEGDN